jgi:hypothetical protein
MIRPECVYVRGDDPNERGLITCDCGQIVANAGQYICTGCFREWARLWKDERNGPNGTYAFQRAAGLIRDGFTVDGTWESFTGTHRDGRTVHETFA